MLKHQFVFHKVKNECDESKLTTKCQYFSFFSYLIPNIFFTDFTKKIKKSHLDLKCKSETTTCYSTVFFLIIKLCNTYNFKLGAKKQYTVLCNHTFCYIITV